MKKYMTVGELREHISGISDETIVTVACENRCDPHPVYGGFFTPTTKEIRPNEWNSERNRVDETLSILTIQLWQDQDIDVSYPQEDYDEDDDVSL